MHSNRIRSAALVAASAFALACGGADAGTGPDTDVREGSPAASIVAATGEQRAAPGEPVPVAPSVKVVDATGAGVAGVSVTFAVTSGGGTVTGGTRSTDASGIATVGSWTLGGTPGENLLRATAAGLAPVTFRAVAAAQAGAYQIELRYVGTPPDAAVQAAFAGAAARWAQVIVGDLPNINTGTGATAGACGETNFPDTRNTAIDDVLIYAEVGPIDGAGKVLGQAKPCFTYQGKTVLGYMTFDSADLANMVSNGSIGDVILHEMGHVIGIGTLWCGMMSRACPETASDTSWIRTTDVRFTGTHGNGAYASIGGTSGTPIENCASGVPSSCGPGTWYGHWREGTFRNELMTGYISASGNPLSALTVGALRDIGYTVNAGAADAYSLPTAASFSGTAPSGQRLEEKPYRGPIFEIDRTGRTVRRLQ